MTSLTIHSLLSSALLPAPAQPALLSASRPPLDRASLLAQLACVRDTLARAGIEPRDRVAIILPNSPVLAVACLGLMTASCCVPLNPAHTGPELRHLLSSMGIRLLLTDSHALPHAAQAAEELGIPVMQVVAAEAACTGVFTLVGGGEPAGRGQPVSAPGAEDIALVLHTSGSTAAPKIVPLTQQQLVCSAGQLIRSLGLTEQDRCLHALPLFHVGALVDLLVAPLAAGGSVLVADSMQADGLMHSLATRGISWYQGVPTLLQDLLQHAQTDSTQPTHYPGLRFLRSVSSPLAPSLLTALEARFQVPVIEIYGMTETAGLITSNPLPPGIRKPGSVGVSAGPDVIIIDATGNPARTGYKGEILVRGANVMHGYEGNAVASTDTFVNGWLRTGDEGFLDRDGYLFITGRIKDIINRGGEKISPREIDDAMMAHPAILEAAAFAMPHPSLGEEVAAAIVLRPGHTLDRQQLLAFLSPQLAYFKLPHSLYFLDALPRGVTGKILRRTLAETVAGMAAVTGTAYEPPRSELGQQLASWWATLLDVPAVGLQDDFFELGGDSLKAATFMVRLQDTLGVDLPVTALFDAPTLGEFEQWLSAELSGPGRPAQVPASAAGLPDDIRRPLVALLAGWAGLRARPDSLLVGHNTLGAGTPVFWVSQDAGDALSLSRSLGPEQPVYFMRSLYEMPSRSPENNRILARHYVDEILSLQPQGPYFLCGFCEGGKIALEIALALLERGQDVALLCLIDQYTPRPYPGRIALLYSQTRFSPYQSYRYPELAWPKLFPGLLSVHHYPWGHNAWFREPVLSTLTGTLRSLLAQARQPAADLSEPSPSLVGQADRLQLTLTPLHRLYTGERRVLTVQLHNAGETTLPSSQHCGVFLRNRWTRGHRTRIWIDGYASWPMPIPPGETCTLMLTITAPMKSGDWLLEVDLVEEGVAWLHTAGITPLQQPLTIRKNSHWVIQRLVRHINKLTSRKQEAHHADSLG